MPRYIDAERFEESIDMMCDAGGVLQPITEMVRQFCKEKVRAEPTIEAEPIPQYINLDSVINDIKQECSSCRYKDADNCQDCTIDRRIHSIEQLCNPKPLYWEIWAYNLLKCPVCEYEYTGKVECTNFCGNCGVPLQFKKEE